MYVYGKAQNWPLQKYIDSSLFSVRLKKVLASFKDLTPEEFSVTCSKRAFKHLKNVGPTTFDEMLTFMQCMYIKWE